MKKLCFLKQGWEKVPSKEVRCVTYDPFYIDLRKKIQFCNQPERKSLSFKILKFLNFQNFFFLFNRTPNTHEEYRSIQQAYETMIDV